MDGIWTAVLFAIFVWWFSTGAILFVVQRAGRGTHPRDGYVNAVVLSLPMLLLGAMGLGVTLDDPSRTAVYLAFVSAIAVWGWFELAFLAGVLTGPAPRPCPEGCVGWERLLRAWGTIAYSEMALIASTMVLVVASFQAPNKFGMWTFLVLFLARIMAKLNVYLGVPNINDTFLPEPVRHLSSHFRRAPMNAFFPFSVTLLTFAVACMIERLIDATPGSGAEAGFALIAALTGLALFEHWMMVLPLPDAALWSWAMPRDKSRLGAPASQPIIPARNRVSRGPAR